jgi:hypothetical protein
VIGAEAEKLFTSEQPALRPDSDHLVATVARVAAAHPSYRVELRGLSRDTTGHARLESFRSALVDKGAPADRIAIVSGPAERPLPAADAVAPEPPTSAADPGVDASEEQAALPVAQAPALPLEIVLSPCG